MPSVPLPAAPLTLVGDSESMPSGPAGTSKAQDRPQSSGGVDWVNAAEFVPGQPYCGRGECVLFANLQIYFYEVVRNGTTAKPDYLPILNCLLLIRFACANRLDQ